MTTKLPPFQLNRHLAEGGMGVVWLASHQATQERAVVKVITGEATQEPAYRDMFQREVLATARLYHRNIVAIHDCGEIPESIDPTLGLDPGAPYYVIEYANRGALEDNVPQTFEELVEMLEDLLLGLSHAHARDVIHRDIKPGNILFDASDDSRYILTDFGIAHAADRLTRTDATDITSSNKEQISGTPYYMAPEQFMGLWRDYGPWTDLYAVGILAYELLTGGLPFDADSFVSLGLLHLRKPFPPLERPRFAVPTGFELWVRRMTAKAIEARFQSAAAALAELRRVVGRADQHDSDQPDSDQHDSDQHDSDQPDWSEWKDEARATHLEGTGLGLFGVRHVPFVGRTAERDRLWRALQEAAKGSSSLAFIHGDSGFGKSKLASWLHVLARERGLAYSLRASFGEEEPYTRGVQGLLHRLMRTAGLTGEDLEDRVDAFLARYRAGDVDTRIICGLLDPGEASTIVPVSQAFETVWRLLGRLAADLPIVLWCDDIHEDSDALKFALHGLDSEWNVLVVATHNDEASLHESALHDYRGRIDEIRGRDDVFDLEIGRMPSADLSELIRLQVQLPEAIMQRVLDRCDGSPLFALQLLDDWVGRGVLRAESGGFVLSGSVPSLPESVRELWRSRVDGLVEDLSEIKLLSSNRVRVASDPDTVHRLLQIAAILGRSVRLEEWREVATRLGVKSIPFLVGELEAARLVERTDEGFVFVHAMLRSLLLEDARSQSSWKATNAACATVLSALYDADHPSLSLRLARHFSQAEAHVPALVAAQHATYEARYAFDIEGIIQGTRVWEDCLEAAGAGPNDLRWVDLVTMRAYAYLLSSAPGHRDIAERQYRESDRITATTDRVSTHVRAASRRLIASIYLGGVENAVTRLKTVLARGGLEGRHDLLAEANVSLSRGCMTIGRIDDAVDAARTAVEVAAHPALLMQAHATMARALLEADDLESARQHNGRAIEVARSKNYLVAEARAHETGAFIEDAFGNFAACERAHVEALRLFELVATRTTYPDKQREYVARAQLAQGKWTEALENVARVRHDLEQGRARFYTHLEDIELACHAGLSDWAAFDDVLDAALTFDDFEPFNLHHRALAIAANHAARGGRTDAAAQIERFLRGIVGDEAEALIERWST